MKKPAVLLSVFLLSIFTAVLAAVPEPVRKTYSFCVGENGYTGPNRTELLKAVVDCQTQAELNPGVKFTLKPSEYEFLVQPTVPVPVNCAGTWSAYARVPGSETACINNLRSFTETRSFTVTTPPSNGGTACPVSPETRTSQESCVSLPVQPLPATTGPVLSVDPTGRYFRLNGQPYFWLADTGWKMNQGITNAEITQYLENRASKGVKVIQGPILVASNVQPPYNGGVDDPFIPGTPMRLNDPWWAPVDHAVKEAGRLGIILFPAVVWGSSNDEVFLPGQEAQHAEFAGLAAKRYGNQAHVNWIAAGEYHKIGYGRNPDGSLIIPSPVHQPTAAEMARYNAVTAALKANAHPTSIVTYHPDGWQDMSVQFGQDARVAFNMLQSSGSLHENLRRVPLVRASSLTKPVVEAETDYEGNGSPDHWQRIWAYNTFMQGAAGYTYGHGKVWDFEPGLWQPALNTTPATEVFTHFRKFVEAHHDERNQPAQNLVVNPGNIGDTGNSYATALRRSDGKKLIAYVTNGRTFQLNTSTLAAGGLTAKWYSPRLGTYSDAVVSRGTSVTIDPPGIEQDGNDWAVIILSSPVPTPVPTTGSVVLTVVPPTENVDGTVVKPPLSWQVSLNGGTAQNATYNNGTVTLTPVSPGTYQARVRVIDSVGDISDWSNSVSVTVSGSGGSVTNILKGRSWRKDVNNAPGARDLTVLGTADWIQFGTVENIPVNNPHWLGAATGTPGTAPTSWAFTSNGGSLTVGDSALANATGVKTLTFATTTNRHVIEDVSNNLATLTTYFAFVRVTVNSGTITFQDLFNIVAAGATPTITGRQVDGVAANATDAVSGSNKLLRIAFTVASASTVGFRVGSGVNANVTANVTFERPLLTTKNTHAFWPTVGDRKSGGTLMGPVEKKVGTETNDIGFFAGDSAENPAASWTDGTVDASGSTERDVVFLWGTASGDGIKMVSGALGNKRYRFVIGYSSYQGNITLTASVSDGSSSNYTNTHNTAGGDVSSFETSVVVEAADPNATLTLALTTSDTDGNVSFQYAYAEEWPYEIAVEDSFTGADNTAIESRTPDVISLLSAAPNGEGAVTGNSYANGIDIVGNAMKMNNTAEVIEYVINAPDAIIELDWVINSTSGHRMHFGIGRKSKDDHFYYNLRQHDNDWNFYRRDAGVQTAIVSGSAKTWGTSKTYFIHIRRVGDNTRLMPDGDILHSYTSATQHKDADRVAIGVAGQLTAGSIDNLTVWRPIRRPAPLTGLISVDGMFATVVR